MEREDLSYTLAMAAKELVEGMQKRVHRNPDIADFRAVFHRVFEEYVNRVLADTDA
jgi:hypothetical protein